MREYVNDRGESFDKCLGAVCLTVATSEEYTEKDGWDLFVRKKDFEGF